MVGTVFRRHGPWLVAAGVACVVTAGLGLALGFDVVVRKGIEFVLDKLDTIASKDKFISVILAAFAAEMLLLGYRNSSIYRFLHPSKSTAIDIYIVALYVTGLGSIATAVITFGATEWMPMVWRRVLPDGDISLIDNAWLSVPLYHLSMSFVTYWCHRWGHSCGWWWEVHRYHHAATELNLITCVRLHPLDIVYEGVVYTIPLVLFGGGAVAPTLAVGVVMLVHSLLNHSNFAWDYGWLGRHVISSPRYHQIHHSVLPEHYDTNYCGRLIVWDWMFGTRYSGTKVPLRYGVVDDPIAGMGFVPGLLHSAMRSYRELGVAILRVVIPKRRGVDPGESHSVDRSDRPLNRVA